MTCKNESNLLKYIKFRKMLLVNGNYKETCYNSLSLTSMKYQCLFGDCEKSYESFKQWNAHYRCHVNFYFLIFFR